MNIIISNTDPALSSNSSTEIPSTYWVKQLAQQEGWGAGGSGYAEPNIFDVVEYGADPTGQSSSQQAFQDAIDDAKAVNKGPGYGAWGNQRCGTVLVPKGSYTGISSLNCSNCVGLTIRGQGSWGSAVYSNGQTSSQPVFDFTQSSYCYISDLCIHSQNQDGSCPNIMPLTAILLADSSSYAGSSNKNKLSNVNIYGHYSSASLSIYRSTNNNFYDCAIHNDYLYAPALYLGKHNYRGLSSPNIQLASAGFVANENAFFGCEFHGAKSASCGYGSLCLDGAQTVQVYGGVCDGNGNGQPIVYFPNESSDILFSGTRFYSENGTAPICIFYNDVSVSRLTTIGCVKDQGISSAYTVYGSGARNNFNLNAL